MSDQVAIRAATNPAQFSVPGDVGLDGTTQDFNMLIGGNFANGKGNATLFFDYRKTDPVLQGDAQFQRLCDRRRPARVWACGGSSTAYPGRFTNGDNGKSYTIANAAGDVRPFSTLARPVQLRADQLLSSGRTRGTASTRSRTTTCSRTSACTASSTSSTTTRSRRSRRAASSSASRSR